MSATIYLYVHNVLYVYNCIHEKAMKPSCILYLVTSWEVMDRLGSNPAGVEFSGSAGGIFDHA